MSTPLRLHRNFEKKSGWRKTADVYVKRYLPTLAYSKRLRKMEGMFKAYEDIFISIAQGDMDGAHRKIGSYEPR